MPSVYTTLEALKRSYMGTWNDEWDERAEDEQIPLVSAMLRKEFKNYGRSLDEDILTGEVEQILVQAVANSMISRRLSASENEMAVGPEADFASLSAGAGPYSFSYTPSPGTSGSFYIKREERRLLGLPSIGVGSIGYNFISGDGEPLVSAE